MKNYFRQVALFCLSILLLMGLSRKSEAQISHFRLSDYKPPAYVHQSLDFGVNLLGSANMATSALADTGQSGSKNSSFSFNFNPVYQRFSNSEKYQGNLTAGLQLSPGFSMQKFKPSNSSESAFQFFSRIQLSTTNRFYIRKGLFIETDPAVTLQSTTYNSNRNLVSGSSNELRNLKERNWAPSFNGSVQLILGKGRIDEVTDAMLSVYMLQDLAQLGCTSKSLSKEDVIALATRITQLKNQRFFDSRLQKIREIESIDSLIQQLGIRSTASAAYFTSLNDDWDYGQSNLRYSGYRFYTGLLPSYMYQAQNTRSSSGDSGSVDSRSRNTTTRFYLGCLAGVDWEKPHSLRWQSSLALEIRYGTGHIESKYEDFNSGASGPSIQSAFTQPGFIASFNYSLGYYPDTRTFLSCGMAGNLNTIINGTEDNQNYAEHTSVSETGLYAGPRFAAYYYLSEKVRLQFNVNIDYFFDDSNSWEYSPLINTSYYHESNTIQGSVTGKLVYSLF